MLRVGVLRGWGQGFSGQRGQPQVSGLEYGYQVITGYELERGDQTRGRREREWRRGEDKSVGLSSHTRWVFREQIDNIVVLFLGAFIVLGVKKMWSTIK